MNNNEKIINEICKYRCGHHFNYNECKNKCEIVKILIKNIKGDNND